MNPISYFGNGVGEAEVSAEVYGGKGSKLSEMSAIGMPVPRGFTLPVDYCNLYWDQDSTDRDAFMHHVVMPIVIEAHENAFGSEQVLLSVRSGARVSMPGMMDTVLNIGLHEESLAHWEKVLGRRAALDSYRRLIEMYLDVVKNQPAYRFQKRMQDIKTFKFGGDLPKSDGDLTERHLFMLSNWYLHDYMKLTGEVFPKSRADQLRESIEAVFKSWNSPRAQHYRKMHGYPNDWGTAVTVQEMVFGNLNDQSCSGVLFTRNPADGYPNVMGEFLPKAQGEDIVAGTRTPQPLSLMYDWNNQAAQDLIEAAQALEVHYNDMQDIEFTVQDGKLYILQTRSGKRTAEAAFRIAYDLYEAKAITKKEMLSRVTAKQYEDLQTTQIDPNFSGDTIATGIPASPGLVSGFVVHTSEEAVQAKFDTILVREETTPEDIHGMEAAKGILTFTGGATSHAAVVARSLNKPCVVGATDLSHVKIPAGSLVTIDGATGRVWDIEVPTIGGGTNVYAEKILDIATAGMPYTQKVSVAQPMPDSGTLWVDFSELNTMNNPVEAVKNVLGTLDVQAVEHSIFVLDMREDAAKLTFTDKKYLTMFECEDAGNGLDLSAVKAAGLSLPLHELRKVAVVLGLDVPGWKSLRRLDSVSALLDSQDGDYVEVTEDLTASVGGKAKMQRLLKMLALDGKKVQALPSAFTREELVSKVLAS